MLLFVDTAVDVVATILNAYVIFQTMLLLMMLPMMLLLLLILQVI